ncbi:hypothetical protein SELMODRAFT_411594 [Selaginella moellendorffii]|uniref:CBF1-interacting co-repressor CIR N-terminal domain-containing protein n=1 Tax=Selaginella moellendorffii TaxID=88036 RepID=D8RIF6_SELML|nr:hypothetical protein SELMODRAFT_411594 [Selaginella moellendorffii]
MAHGQPAQHRDGVEGREAEKRKLEELQKQIRDEQDHLEFRKLQEQAGLVPRQERLDFLYESGLGVGKPSNEEYLLEIQQVAATPGSLFVEEKISANDKWRKTRSDPLLLIRQQELAARERIKSNPLKMEALRKEIKVEEKQKRKALKKKTKENGEAGEPEAKRADRSRRAAEEDDDGNKRASDEDDRYSRRKRSAEDSDEEDRHRNKIVASSRDDREDRSKRIPERDEQDRQAQGQGGKPRLRQATAAEEEVQLSEEEKMARLREMQQDAELHEEQRWQRIKRASASDAVQEEKDSIKSGKNFLDETNRSVYGTENGGSASVADTLHRRSHYREKFTDKNAFRRS